MIYTFKPKPEMVRAVGLALGTFLLEALSDPRLATDPRGWAIAAGIGAGHVVVAAILGLYSTPQGQPVAPVMPPSAPVAAVQPPVGLPGEQGGVWLNGAWVTPLNFGASDVRVGNTSGLVVQPRPAPAPPAPTPDELAHQRRRDSALKGWNTRRAEAAQPPPQTAPDKPRARKRG